MLCFKFLKSSGFTEKLKPLGILVPIRKPERGKTSHKHYILGLKLKKLDALTSKKTVFFVNRGLSFKLQTGSLHSSVLLSTFFTLNWNFDTFFESQNALTFKIFESCNVCCKRYVNLLSKAFSDLGGLVNCLTGHRRDEKVFLGMGNARHHLLVYSTLTYIVITAKTKLVTLHAICIGKTYNLVKTCLFSERPRGYKDHISMNCIYIDLSKPNFERKVRHDYVIAFPESKLYVLSLKENAILINFKLYNSFQTCKQCKLENLNFFSTENWNFQRFYQIRKVSALTKSESGSIYCSICINPHSKDFSVLTALARKHDRQREDTLIFVVVILKPHQVFTHRIPNNIMKPAIFNYSNSHAKLFPRDL